MLPAGNARKLRRRTVSCLSRTSCRTLNFAVSATAALHEAGTEEARHRAALGPHVVDVKLRVGRELALRHQQRFAEAARLILLPRHVSRLVLHCDNVGHCFLEWALFDRHVQYNIPIQWI